MMCHFIISLTVHASSPNLIFQPVKPRVEKQPYKVQAVTIGDTEVASAQVPPGRPGPRPARLQLQGRRAHRPQSKRCEARSPLRNPFRRHVRQPGLLHARQWWMWWEREWAASAEQRLLKSTGQGPAHAVGVGPAKQAWSIAWEMGGWGRAVPGPSSQPMSCHWSWQLPVSGWAQWFSKPSQCQCPDNAQYPLGWAHSMVWPLG